MRQVTHVDAPQLARLIHAVWADHNPNPERIARVSLESNHVTLVEQADNRLVGFVDAFSTVACDGTPRWEIDLLGVHPKWRGRGIAQRLVRASLEAGRQLGARMARALVRTDNAASLKAFANCGFASDGAVHDLCVSDQDVDGRLPVPRGAFLLAVSTLTYSGVWVEGEQSPEALRCAQAVRRHYGWLAAGAVVPAGTLPMETTGYDHMGQYYWLRFDY